MAKNTKHIPVYVASRELAKLIFEQVKEFPRDYRPTLGNIMAKEALELILHIYRANVAENKAPHLTIALEKLQVTEMLLQTAHDLKLISVSKYAESIDLTESIGKQAGGWRKSSAKVIIECSNQSPQQRPDFAYAKAYATAPKSGSNRETAKSRNAAHC